MVDCVNRDTVYEEPLHTTGTYSGDDDNNNDEDDDDGSDNNEGRMEDTENLRSRLRERRRTEERQKATEKEKREVFR